MVELALVVVEPEQQRADEVAVRRVAEAADDAVGAAQALDLQHRALAGDVRPVERAWRSRRRARRRPCRAIRAPPRPCGCRARAASPRLRRGARRTPPAPRGARSSGSSRQASPSGVIRQSNRIRMRRRLARELADAALGRVQAHLQGVEGQRVAVRDRELAVDHEAVGRKRAQHRRRPRGSSAPAACRISPCRSTSSPARKARQRKPSHFGSNCQPGSLGSVVDELRLHRRRADRHRQGGEAGELSGLRLLLHRHHPSKSKSEGIGVRSATCAREHRIRPCPRASWRASHRRTAAMTIFGHLLDDDPPPRPVLPGQPTEPVDEIVQDARRRSRRRAPGSCRP